MTSPRPVAVLLAVAVALDLAGLPLAGGVQGSGSIAAVALPLVVSWVLWRGTATAWVLPGLAFAATDGALAAAGLPALLPLVDTDPSGALLPGLAALARVALLPVALPGLRARLADRPARPAVARLGAAGAVALATAPVVDLVGALADGFGRGPGLAGLTIAAVASALVLLALATVLHAGRDRAAAIGVLAALVLVAVPTLGAVVALDRGGFTVSPGTWLRLAASLPLVAALLLAARRGPPDPHPDDAPGGH